MTPFTPLEPRALRSGIIVATGSMILAIAAPSGRGVGLTVMAASIVGLPTGTAASADDRNGAIRRFQVHVPEEKLVDLRCRLAATQWPDKETVNDPSMVPAGV